MAHLGPRVSALLDGALSPAEEERAWGHVHACHFCRDLVEREGWVKTRLAGLSWADPVVPDSLKGSLLGPGKAGSALTPSDVWLAMADRPRRSLGLAAIGGGAVGAAVVGVLMLGVAPASAPTIERRPPANTMVGMPTLLPHLSMTTPGP